MPGDSHEARPMGTEVPHRGNQAAGPTLQRALDILLMFVDQPTMTVRVLSERLALRKSTAYRFVSGLRGRGFLDELGDGSYRLGPRILQLAEAARPQLGIIDLSSPIMAELAQATGGDGAGDAPQRRRRPGRGSGD